VFASRSRFEGHARTCRPIARFARHPVDANAARHRCTTEGLGMPPADPRTKPLSDSGQNESQGRSPRGVTKWGPALPPTEPRRRVLSACVSGDARRHASPSPLALALPLALASRLLPLASRLAQPRRIIRAPGGGKPGWSGVSMRPHFRSSDGCCCRSVCSSFLLACRRRPPQNARSRTTPTIGGRPSRARRSRATAPGSCTCCHRRTATASWSSRT